MTGKQKHKPKRDMHSKGKEVKSRNNEGQSEPKQKEEACAAKGRLCKKREREGRGLGRWVHTVLSRG